MNALPTGLFLPGDSLIHRLDSRSKLLALFITIVAVLCVNSLVGYGIMIVFAAAIILLAGISLPVAFNSVNKLGWFFIVILLMNTFFYSPENAWFSFWIFNPSTAGLMQGIDVVFRIFLVLIITNAFTSATAPMEITNALESLMSPFIGGNGDDPQSADGQRGAVRQPKARRESRGGAAPGCADLFCRFQTRG